MAQLHETSLSLMKGAIDTVHQTTLIKDITGAGWIMNLPNAYGTRLSIQIDGGQIIRLNTNASSSQVDIFLRFRTRLLIYGSNGLGENINIILD